MVAFCLMGPMRVQGIRMFKKFIAATLLLLCSIGASAANEPPTPGNRYENLALGLRVTKPDSWRFITAEENVQSLKRMEFSSEEFKQKVLAYATPVVALMQYPEDHIGVNPAVKLTIKSLEGIPDPTAEVLLKVAEEGIREEFADAKVSTITEALIAGRSGRRMSYDYSARTTDGGELSVSSVLWVVLEGDFFLMIGAAYPQGERAALEQIEQVVKTVEWTTTPIVKE